MAKRLTDTDKWKDEWFLSLPNDYKTIWQYMLDNCTHAGIFKKGFELMNFCCKTSIKEEELKTVFNGRLKDCGNFYFIPRFITFQYGDLRSNRPVILSVVKELERLDLLSMVKESLPNDYLTIKSKSMAKSKRTAKSKSNNIKPFSTIPPKEFKDCVK